MSFKKKLKFGKMFAKVEHKNNGLLTERKRLRAYAVIHKRIIKKLDKEVNELKTMIVMMENEKAND